MSAKILRRKVDEKCNGSIDEDPTVKREIGISKEGRKITTRQMKGQYNSREESLLSNLKKLQTNDSSTQKQQGMRQSHLL